LLRDRLIKILPIAQQTTHVGSGTTDGETDGSLNARAIIDTFGSAYLHGAAPDVLVFLDVEKGLPLSRSYYIAWSAALQKTANQLSGGNVSLHPAIYASFSDDTTWAALRSAIAAGAPCAGAWIARWKSTAGGCFPLDEWDEAHVTPTGGLPCPVLLWQYSQECNGFDCDQASPFHEDVLLGRLVLPPALAVA
jgi:hypothetical protein